MAQITTCCCASEDCAKNGCIRIRGQYQSSQLELIEEARALLPQEYRQLIADAICNAWCGGFNECVDLAKTQRSSLDEPAK